MQNPTCWMRDTSQLKLESRLFDLFALFNEASIGRICNVPCSSDFNEVESRKTLCRGPLILLRVYRGGGDEDEAYLPVDGERRY